MGSEAGQRGFSVTELLAVIGVITVAAAIATVNGQTALRNFRAETAYETTLMQMRNARQAAVDQRRVFAVTFQPPRTIVTQYVQGGTLFSSGQMDLPFDMQFRAEPGIPTSASRTPDNFGTAAAAVDFSVDYGGGRTQVYFQPDGSAKDSLGRSNNGVVYLARPGELSSARAVSLFGATGRIKGWRLQINSDGTTQWR